MSASAVHRLLSRWETWESEVMTVGNTSENSSAAEKTAFFYAIFKPFGSNVTAARQYLIKQGNAWRYLCVQGILENVLGVCPNEDDI